MASNNVLAFAPLGTHEKIVGIGGMPADPEELKEVMKLAMDIADNCYR